MPITRTLSNFPKHTMITQRHLLASAIVIGCASTSHAFTAPSLSLHPTSRTQVGSTLNNKNKEGNLHGQGSCFLPLLQNDEEYIAPRIVQVSVIAFFVLDFFRLVSSVLLLHNAMNESQWFTIVTKTIRWRSEFIHVEHNDKGFIWWLFLCCYIFVAPSWIGMLIVFNTMCHNWCPFLDKTFT